MMRLFTWRLVLAVCVVVLQTSVWVGAESASPRITAVDSIGMTVSDMNRSVEFYTKVLTFKPVSDVEVWVRTMNGFRVSLGCACGWYAYNWVRNFWN